MAQRQLPVDFKEFIQCLNNHSVRYLLVGGWALGVYGNPRATKDIDFLIAIDSTNISQLQESLHEFGAPTVSSEVFKVRGNIFRMGSSPIQIDIINHADGINIDECFPRRQIIEVDGLKIPVISKADLIVNKRSSGRLRDLADVEYLESDE
ncbi:MAG: nucleotidyltransferase [Spirochaetaceae bacterium]|nr:nucleotidyltransferase [Spirochaetaceae bacterium]